MSGWVAWLCCPSIGRISVKLHIWSSQYTKHNQTPEIDPTECAGGHRRTSTIPVRQGQAKPLFCSRRTGAYWVGASLRCVHFASRMTFSSFIKILFCRQVYLFCVFIYQICADGVRFWCCLLLYLDN